MIIKRFYLFFLIFSGLFEVLSAKAGEYKIRNYLDHSSISNQVIVVKDPLPALHPGYGPKPETRYEVRVALRFDNNQLYPGDADWALTVDYSLRFYNEDGTSNLSHTPLPLTISHSALSSPVYLSTTHLDQYPTYSHVRLTVDNVTGVFREGVTLELELLCQREELLSDHTVLGRNAESGLVYWSYLPGAEAYELEWVYLDKEDPSSLSISSPEQPFSLQEPVRISTSHQYFEPSFTYPEGTVYYRVRGVGRYWGSGSKSNAYSDWFYGDGGVVLKYEITEAFEEDKNWQYVTSYAEEGKYKKVVQYFDGSYRSRQTLTNLSSEKSVLVAETKYDYEGRKKLDILPVPIRNGSLHYIPSMIGIGSGTKADYDRPQGAMALSPLSQAAIYYSSANNYDQINGEYVPDAEGYAFSQVEYTRDQTGRLSRSSMPGKELKLDDPTTSTRYTRNFYGNASESELRRLFGSNVGLAKHYRKNLSIDPNGQASVSYLDQEGRVIATALIGNNPTSLEALPSNVPSAVTESLNEKNEVDADNGTSRSVSEIVNAIAGTDYTFRYDITGVINKAAQFCESCEYDLEIRFVDPDGIEIPGSRITKMDITAGTIASCASSPVTYSDLVPDKIIRFEKVGVYTVSKELKLTAGAFDVLLHKVQDEPGYPVLATYINSHQALIDVSECETDCDALPDCDEVRDFYLEKTIESSCASLKQQMLLQVKPGGYYYELGGTVFDNIYAASPAIWHDENNNTIIKPSLADVKNPTLFIDDWALNLVEGHPEYCQIGFCEEEAAGALFDARMAQISNWTEAAVGPDYTSPVNTDPYFAVGGPGQAYRTDMQQWLASYVDEVNYGQDLNGNAITNDQFSLEQFVKLNLLYNRTPTAEESWAMFRSVYMGEKMKKQIERRKTQGCQYLDPEAEQTIVIEPDMIGSADMAHSYNHEALQQHCAGMCEESAHVWISLLENSCMLVLNPADRDIVYNNFRLYCEENCDYTNYKGLPDFSKDPTSPYLSAVINVLNQYPQSCDLNRISRSDECLNPTNGELLIVNRRLLLLVSLLNDFLAHIIEISNSENSLTNGLQNYNNVNFDLELFPTFRNNWYNFSYTRELPYGEPGNLGCYISYRGQSGSIFHGFCNGSFWNSILPVLYTIPPVNWRKIIRVERGVDGNIHYVIQLMDNSIYTYNSGSNSFYRFLTSPVTDPTFTDISYSACADSEDNTCEPIRKLDLTRFCSPDQYTRRWRVSNPNPFSVQFTWEVTGTSQKGLLTVDANGDAYFESHTSLSPTAHTAVIKVKGILHDQEVNGYQSCSSNIIISTVPTETPASLRTWRITNPTGQDVVFNYHVPGLGPGTVTVSKRKDAYITVSRAYGSVGYITYNSVNYPNYGELAVYSYDAENLKCDYSFTTNWNEQKLVCLQRQEQKAIYDATEEWKEAVSRFTSQYLTEHINKCFGEHFSENFNYSFESKEYHHTLYYYDQAGNLVQTIPPNGVDVLPASAFDSKGNYLGSVQPQHRLKTVYRYNSLNQLVWQNTPDGGEISFWYDRKGQLRLSQNAKQARLAGNYQYSFTRYDRQGRIVQVGQIGQWNKSRTDLNNQSYLYSLLDNPEFPQLSSSEFTLNQLVTTVYDENTGSVTGSNLRGRVAETHSQPEGQVMASSYYSYDAHGNVDKLTGYLNGLGYNTTEYNYDLLSGKVNKVYYQRGEPEQFIHAYEYDADNRIRAAYTSKNDYDFEEDARYFYYAHGPLSRVEIGHDKVQGLDYYYTLQGWLKGVNKVGVKEERSDPGSDSYQISVNKYVPSDEFGYMLGYYKGDYKAVLPTVQMGAGAISGWDKLGNVLTSGVNAPKGLFNGNISIMLSNTPAETEALMGRVFKYDQLNRLTESFSSLNYSRQAGWTIPQANRDYYEKFAYDANGNIVSALRYNKGTQLIDNLSYRYDLERATNRLYMVNDAAGKVTDNDLPNQGVFHSAPVTINVSNNYGYDEIGNLVRDNSAAIMNIDWLANGKIAKIFFWDGRRLEFAYDPAGNRISKTFVHNSITEWTDYYVRDASGNIMANYRKDYCSSAASVSLRERPIYGSSRLGVNNEVIVLQQCGTPYSHQSEGYERHLGNKEYELTDHLGNVRVVVSDVKAARLHSAREYFYDYEKIAYEEGDCRCYASFRSTEEAHTGQYSVKLIPNPGSTRYGPSIVLPVGPGDIVNIGVFMKFVEETTGGRLRLEFKDSNGAIISSFNSETYTDGHTIKDQWNYVFIPAQTAPSNAVSIFADVRLPNGRSTSWFDNFSLTIEKPASGSPVQNKSAHYSYNYDDGRSYPEYDCQCFSNHRDITESRSGNVSMKVTPQQDFGPNIVIPVQAGDRIRGEVYTKFLSGTQGGILVFHIRGGTGLQPHYSSNNYSDARNKPGDWERAFIPDVVVPEGPVEVIAYFRTTSGSSTTWFDDFNLTITRGNTELRYSAEVKSYSDYYAFGMQMPGRYANDGYRYGFNGKEDDKETGYQDYGVRQYNPKLGRFFSADPLIIQGQQYLYLSPYQFAGNNPIAFVDLDGLEPAQYIPNGDGTFITVPASDRIPVPVDPNAKFQNTNRTNGYSVLDFLGDLFSLNFGFVFYSSGGTDPNAQVERNAKHRVPIDMQDVEDATLGADKSTGKSRNPIQQKDVKKAFDEQANQQRNNPQNAQYNMPRDTPDGDPFKDKQEKTGAGQGAGNNQQQGTYYKGSPQGSDFTLYDNDKKVFERKDNVVILGGEQ